MKDECLSWYLFNLLKELFWRCNLDPKLLASGEVTPIECHNLLHSSGYSQFQHHVVPGVREKRTPQEKYLPSVCHSTQIVQDVIKVPLGQLCLVEHPFCHCLVLGDKRNRKVEFEKAASSKC